MVGSCLRTRLLLLVLMVAGLLIVPSAASGAYTFGSEVTPVGPQETVFDYSAQPRCGGDTNFFQDAGSRALRDASGRVVLIMSHAGTPNSPGGHTRRLLGVGGLANLPFSVDCTVIHSSDNKPAQSTFDNWEWLVSPFTEDGQTVHALVHNEYHGWEHSGQCPGNPNPGGFLPRCWYNAITLAKSTNRGDSYSHASSEPVANHLIASIPYQYSSDPVPGQAESKGYFQPTNIVKKEGWYYALFRAEVYQAQNPRGACLMRTNNLDDPDSWRGWDGLGFTVDFVDPYAEAGTFMPAEHVCKPVTGLGTLANNLVYSRHFKRYMIIDQNRQVVNGVPTDGVFYSLSDDLINWDPPKLLMKANPAWACVAPELGIRVPSLIDPNSTDRNYNTIGQTAHLYFEESQTCPEGLDRDLLRVKVRFDAKPAGDRLATLEGGQAVDPATGFDTAWNGTPGRFDIDSAAPAYEGSKSARLFSLGGNTGPWGSFNVSWPNGTDVWYGSAFFLQVGFAASNDRIAVTRWHNSTAVPPSPTRFGGIVLGTDDRYRIVRGVTGGSEDTIGASFTLPEGRWVWLEVHQKLESDPAKSPYSEVFVDGQPVADTGGRINSTAPNAYPDGAGVPNRVQYGYADRSQGNSTLMSIDHSSVSLSQRGPVGAPPTPGSFSGTEQDRLVTIYWQATPPPGGGFRVYKQDPDTGAWSWRFDKTTTGVFESGLTNCKRYNYRISAYDAQGRESVVSEPLELMPRGAQGC